MNTNERVMKSIDNMARALDVVTPKRQFRITRIWEGKKGFCEAVREAVARRDAAYIEAIYTG